MKNIIKIVLIGLLSLQMMAGMTMAQEQERSPYKMRQGLKVLIQPMRQLLRFQMHNAGVEVLAEMTDQSQEIIKGKLELKPIFSVLRDENVDPEQFHAKMHAKIKTMIQKAGEAGIITKEQSIAIIENMALAPQNMRFMKKMRKKTKRHMRGWEMQKKWPRHQEVEMEKSSQEKSTN